MRSLYHFLGVLCFVLCYMIQSLQAQTGRFYSTENGLTSSLVNQIFQDSRGYIWAATEYGLNKFDGLHFVSYHYAAKDSTTLKNDYVRTMFEDSRCNLWVGCMDGLMKYDYETDMFHEVPMIRNGKKVNPHITRLCELHTGEIWVATTGQGLFRLDEGKNRACSLDTLLRQANYNFQYYVYEDSHFNVWIGTEGNGLICYSPATKLTSIYKYPSLLGNNISCILEDENENLFVGIQGQGLMKLDRASGQFKQIPYYKGGSLSVDCFCLADGELLLGTDGQGLKIYRSERNSIEDYEINSAPLDFSEGKIHCLMHDRDGNLWMGLFQKGIMMLPRQEYSFEYYGNRAIYYNPIGKGCVMSVFQDRDDYLWIASDNEGVFQLDADGRRICHYAPTGTPYSVANTVMSIYEDSEGTLWLGSYMRGICKLDRVTGRCEYLHQLASEKVLSITEDKRKNLYIATLGSGFYLYSLKTGILKHYESSKDETGDLKRNELPNDYINYLFCDSEGIVWIGHYQGISCFNPQTGSFLDISEANILVPGCVGYVFMEDAKGDIWAGTNDGLFVYEKGKRIVAHYTMENGLPNNVICGICEDENQQVWVSTYSGISRYNQQTKAFVNYSVGDGLQGNEFTHGAFFKNKDGKIFFGGVNGVTAFIPSVIGAYQRDLEVWLTGFSVYDRPVHKHSLSGGKEIIRTSVQDANEFRLAHNDNTFTIQFSTLSFDNPEQIRYQYMIEELGGKWLMTEPGTNKVTYNNLPPGRYTFSVRALNHGKMSKVRTATIRILPPWYQTGWAYAIYWGLLVLLLVGIINYVRTRTRHRKELLAREYAEQINEAKLQFFINISHEIRTPMTLIINPLEKLLSEKKDTETHQTYLMIYRNAQRILRLINQLMDIRKLDKGQMKMKFQETDMVGFIDDLILTFGYMAEKKHIHFEFKHEMQTLPVWIDLNNFDKVLMNILSNAFKYTPEDGEITVELGMGEDVSCKGPLKEYVEITITDNGIGIDKDKIDRIFERFYQVDNDVTKSNFGTGIGLHLSRSLVQLHHGTIKAENREDTSGTRFIVRIPMGADHLRADELERQERKDVLPSTVRVHHETLAVEDSAGTIDRDSNKVKAKTKWRILIAEDEDEIRSYLKTELSDEYKVQVCADGKEAYERILTDMPDLIISDVMMPNMDGFTLCRKIRQNPHANHIPVVLLTAKTTPEDRMEGMETGADAYMVKPFDMELLRSAIANLIANRSLLRNKFTGAQLQADKIEKITMKSGDEKLMNKIMKTVNEHLADSNFSVEMLASEVGLSRVHLHRKLKELTNLSARDFIKNIRLQQAASLLTSGQNLSVSEVAYAVGYANLSHFSTSFKEMYGVSPKEYMEKQIVAH